MKRKPSKCKVRGRKRWYVEEDDPLTGKRHRTLFDTETAANAYQDEINRRPTPTLVHPLLDTDIDLQAFAVEWLDKQTLGGTLRRNTLSRYRLHLNHICRFAVDPVTVLGTVKVRTLSAGHVVALATAMRRDKSHPRTVAATIRLVRLLLDRAVHHGLLPRHPISAELYRTDLQPLLAVPRHLKHDVRAFTEPDIAHFLAVAREHSPLADLYTVGVLAGLRLGELLGLQLDDDVTTQGHRTLYVQRTLYRGHAAHPICGPCKGGVPRHVDVSATLGAVLDRIRAQRPRLAMQHGWRPVPPWLFLTSAGHIIDQEHVRRDFKRMLDLGHLKLSPHALRHTFATLHILRGCNVQWLRQQLGHSSVKITLDTYGNHFPIPDVGAADALADALVGNTSGNTTTA